LPKRLSYSYIHQFTCPYAAFLRYEAGIKGPTNEYLALGSAFHYALEMEHRSPEWNLKECIELFSKEFRRIIEDENVFIPYPKLKKFESDGIDMIELYDNNLENRIIQKPVEIELEFSLPVRDTTIVGAIDKLDHDELGWTVTDYKTGSKAPDQWFLDHNLQFTTYAWAIQQLKGEIPYMLYWYQARTGKLLETHRNQEDIDELKDRIEQVLNLNAQGIRYRIYDEAVCSWCDYSSGWGKTGICGDRELEKKLVAKINQEKLSFKE
jgi:hypothetical protein